jgi:hypothetical protein
VGQSGVLFSILLTKNKDKFLPWVLMFLLTGLQVTANVYASFKYMLMSGSNDYLYWQKSILFGVQASTPEMYQVIISWISGALLPIVALGMTALVATNIKLMSEDEESKQLISTKENNHLEQTLNDFSEKLISKQKDIDPEYTNIVNDNFWDLIDETDKINNEDQKPKEEQSSFLEQPEPPHEINAIIDDGGIGGEEAKEEAQKLEEISKNLIPESDPIAELEKQLEQEFKTPKEDLSIIENEKKDEVKESIIPDIKGEEMTPESIPVSSKTSTPYNISNSVEVIEAKDKIK